MISSWLSLTSGLTPHGVSGLKLSDITVDVVFVRSHPTRGEWIEILYVSFHRRQYRRLTPHGVSGLKFTSELDESYREGVSPHTG